MVFVEGGTFMMESEDSEAYGDEKSAHNKLNSLTGKNFKLPTEAVERAILL